MANDVLPAPYQPKPKEDRLSQEQHRKTILEMGNIISGAAAVAIDESTIWVYRVPSPATQTQWLASRIKTGYGKLEYTSGGFTADGKWVRRIVTEPEETMQFLTTLLQIVSSHRRDLALDANRQMEYARRPYQNPGGSIGNLVAEYDKLIDLIKHEYYLARRRSEPDTI